MHQTVENRIRQRRVTDGLMPMFDRQLAGDDGGAGAVPVIEDFEQVTPAFIGQWCQPPVINLKTAVTRFHSHDFQEIGGREVVRHRLERA